MKALGMIEVYGYPTAIEALDSAVKAANVSVVDMVKVSGGLVTVTVEGDVGAVKASMEAAEVAAKMIGNVMSVHVIARPDEGIEGIIAPEVKAVPEPVVEEVEEKAEPKPVAKEASPAPVTKEASPAPVVPKAAPKPVAKKADPKPAPKKAEPKPAVKKAEPKPVESKVPEKKDTPKKAGKHTLEQLSTMKVVDLRSLARELGNTGLTNKEIRFGNKVDLIAAILGGK